MHIQLLLEHVFVAQALFKNSSAQSVTVAALMELPLGREHEQDTEEMVHMVDDRRGGK